MVQDRCAANLDAALSRTPAVVLTLVNSSMCADHWKADSQATLQYRNPVTKKTTTGRHKTRIHRKISRTMIALLSGLNWNQDCIRSDTLTHLNIALVPHPAMRPHGHRRSKRITRPPAIRPGQEIACRPSWPRTPSSADRWCGPWDPSGCVPPPRRSARTALGSPCR